jgi:hypothetical protein
MAFWQKTRKPQNWMIKTPKRQEEPTKDLDQENNQTSTGADAGTCIFVVIK